MNDISGVTVLSEYACMPNIFDTWIFWVPLGIAIVLAFFLIIIDEKGLLVLCIIPIIAGILLSLAASPWHTQYKCLVGDEALFIPIVKDYEFVSQDGLIYIFNSKEPYTSEQASKK